MQQRREQETLNDEQAFRMLANRWRQETGMLSSPVKKAMHPDYQRIIGMGRTALPLIFRELRDRGGYWYWALAAITRENPVPEECAGNIAAMKKAWIQYAVDHDLI